MRRQLEYKQQWLGANTPPYTTEKCTCCDHTIKENRRTHSEFECLACRYTANADINGARHILAAGHAVLACGAMVQPSLKQEPDT